LSEKPNFDLSIVMSQAAPIVAFPGLPQIVFVFFSARGV
jgi:hypothetical protein